MNILVTGAAGFIGSHLCRRLLSEGYSVTGVDSFTDYYPRWMKERNVAPLLKARRFKLIDKDLNKLPLRGLLQGVDAVYHLAAQAGVRASWGRSFSVYLKNNIQASRVLLEAAKELPLRKFVYASSSSVYGLTPDIPMTETSLLYPLSPYGVSKLAAEQLCFLYHKNYGTPTVALRFFTVYGPGQRPDMAFHKFFKAIHEGEPITVYGDGRQTRDFTFVGDIVEANLAALTKSLQRRRRPPRSAERSLPPLRRDLRTAGPDREGRGPERRRAPHVRPDRKGAPGSRLQAPDGAPGRPGPGVGLDPPPLCARGGRVPARRRKGTSS